MIDEEGMAVSRGRGTIGPAANFNAEKVASRLRKAMRGIGTDEKVIIDVLTSHNNAQRQVIKKKYKTMYGRILTEDLRAELGGHFEDVCLALLAPLSEYIIDCLYYAVKGFKTDEKCIIEILCALEDMELQYIKSAFKEKYSQDTETFLTKGLDGSLGKIVRSLMSSGKEEFAEVDDDLAHNDAQKLYDAGVAKMFGTEDDTFIKILSKRSKTQLKATIDAYEKIAGHSLEDAIKSEFSGKIRNVLLAIVLCVENRFAFFAQELHDALKGPGTDDKTLIRVLVSRSEIDLADIIEWYHMKFDTDLSEAIYADTSGDYRKILLKLVNP